MSKENTVISKIPIPLDPLPPLSELALQKRLISKPEQPRHPLETLYQESTNVEGAVVNRKVKKVLARSNSALTKLDTQHVTIRQNSEELDWSYSVFNDNLHDDDDNKDNLTRTVNDTHEGDCGRVSTPAFKSLPEPVRSRIRNVKKSLKRPHSRELIGISPAVSGDKGEEKFRRRLDFTDRIEPTFDSYLKSYAQSYIKDYGLDLFDYLLKRETIPRTPRIPNSGRACIMNWLVKVNGPKGNPAAVQTAAWYFDNVLAEGTVQVNKLQVVAVACYWIALKIQGQVTSAKKLVTVGANAYSAKLLLCAEKAVLEKLKFPTQPIVPQDFISYWSWVCDASNYVDIEAAATLLFMASLVMHKELVHHYPSVSAAAAMSNALHLLRRKESLVKLKENAVYKVAAKKEQHFGDLCSLQREALRRMSSPFCKYRAVLNNFKDYTLTDKILTSLKTKTELKPA